MAVLRKAAEYCNFGESLSEMLRDRLVCGITDTTVQKRLLAEKELTLERAVSLVQSVEIAKRGQRTCKAPQAVPTKFTSLAAKLLLQQVTNVNQHTIKTRKFLFVIGVGINI